MVLSVYGNGNACILLFQIPGHACKCVQTTTVPCSVGGPGFLAIFQNPHTDCYRPTICSSLKTVPKKKKKVFHSWIEKDMASFRLHSQHTVPPCALSAGFPNVTRTPCTYINSKSELPVFEPQDMASLGSGPWRF